MSLRTNKTLRHLYLANTRIGSALHFDEAVLKAFADCLEVNSASSVLKFGKELDNGQDMYLACSLLLTARRSPQRGTFEVLNR